MKRGVALVSTGLILGYYLVGGIRWALVGAAFVLGWMANNSALQEWIQSLWGGL